MVDAIERATAQIKLGRYKVITSLQLLGVEADHPALILYRQSDNQDERDAAFNECLEWLRVHKGIAFQG